jgi:myo-inositol 2-dehydrogenase/D-chiro-inositol 1-dehydrogenase
VHVHSMCRQIEGCASNVSELVRGTEGYTNCVDRIWRTDGTESWKYPYALDEEGEEIGPRPYRQEHVDLVTAIRTNTPVNEAARTAASTLIAIMGRISCYTGQEVTWEEMMESGLKLGPDRLELGPSDLVRAVVPVPGTA